MLPILSFVKLRDMKMDDKVTVLVHRGSHQIGGCCTTISYKSSCIAIDLGSPLEEERTLRIPGLTEGKRQYDALFLTHYHEDHIGEADKVLSEVPIYTGACAKEIILAYQNHMGKHSPYHFSEQKIHVIEPESPLVVGDFTVTAIASDHSAVGTLMYLIEVGGKRILHTGDFRLHGPRREVLMGKMRQLGRIDLLITEGTTLSRKSDVSWDEGKVREELVKMYRKFKYCFVLASTTNLDRIQAISEPVEEGKYFLVNSFQYEIMKIAEKYKLCTFQKPLQYGENLDKKIERRGFTMVVGANERSRVLMEYYFQKYPQDTCLIYSMWSGYKEKENIKQLCDMAGDRLFHIHSSGHVVLQDLNQFVEVINPTKMMVIHTDCADKSSISFSERLIEARDDELIVL